MRRARPATRAALSLAVWSLAVIFAPVILLAGEPVNRYVMRVRRSGAAGPPILNRHGDRPARTVPVHLPGQACLLLVVISNPLWIALTAPGRWVRAAGAADESGRTLEDLVSSLAADGHEILGDVMKRVPRGYPAGHPRAGLLRYRSLIAARELESDAVRDVEPVYRACERLRPLLEWLAEHVVTTSQGPGVATPSVAPLCLLKAIDIGRTQGRPFGGWGARRSR